MSVYGREKVLTHQAERLQGFPAGKYVLLTFLEISL